MHFGKHLVRACLSKAVLGKYCASQHLNKTSTRRFFSSSLRHQGHRPHAQSRGPRRERCEEVPPRAQPW